MGEHDGLGERVATLEAQWVHVERTLNEVRGDVKTLLADQNRSAGRWAGWVAGAAAVTSLVGILLAITG